MTAGYKGETPCHDAFYGQGAGAAPPVSRLRALRLALIEAEAGLLIGLNPSCSRWASLLVDRCTTRRDALLEQEVWV